MDIVIGLTLIAMMGSLIWFPVVRMQGKPYQTFWMVAVVGALIIWGFQDFAFAFLSQAWLTEGAINPLRILGLFFAFTILAIFLDEVGLIKYLAYRAVKMAGQSQHRLFSIWFMVVALATMITANDIVILTLTPFIIYLARHAKVSPLPYLISQFVAANTWSMVLIIGNPTNIYLASMFGISFFEYLQVMIFPTLITGLVSFGLLYGMFYRLLRHPIHQPEMIINPPHPSYRLGLSMLGFTIVFMAVAPWLNLSMDGITMGIVMVFIAWVAIRYPKEKHLRTTLEKLPYAMIPFFLSMTVVVSAINVLGWTETLASWLSPSPTLYRIGISSFLLSNVINNIPMSVWFASILMFIPNLTTLDVYAAIIGSNLGALLTPVGALAGLMWLGILKAKQVNFHFATFLTFGMILGPILLGVALWMLDVFSH